MSDIQEEMFISYKGMNELLRRAIIGCTFASSIKCIVAVSRGGLVPAIALAHVWGIKNVRIVRCDSYNDQERTASAIFGALAGAAGSPKWLPHIDWTDIPDIRDVDTARTLVVDDIFDSGRTMAAINRILPNTRKFVLMCKKPAAFVEEYGGFYGAEVRQNTWVKFPWETLSDNGI